MTQHTLGWREWIALPDLGVTRLEAKIDTGARSSALHAVDIEPFERDGVAWVRFSVTPPTDGASTSTTVEARVHDRRNIKNSGGTSEERWVITTTLVIGDAARAIELTLTDRTEMGHAMLVGRTALSGDFVVDPSQAYLAGSPIIEQ